MLWTVPLRDNPLLMTKARASEELLWLGFCQHSWEIPEFDIILANTHRMFERCNFRRDSRHLWSFLSENKARIKCLNYVDFERFHKGRFVTYNIVILSICALRIYYAQYSNPQKTQKTFRKRSGSHFAINLFANMLKFLKWWSLYSHRK